jgi:predicted aminopeptidase
MLTDTSAAISWRLVFLLLIPALLSGCGSLYIAQAARGQWQVLRQRQPLAQVLSDQRTPAELQVRLRYVQEARDFAVAELALPDNDSYRSYADLKRPFVVWNVVVVPEFSLEPQKWCFPVAGCVSYRGYFKEAAANRFADQQRKQNYDVLVAGVPAYSTLGRFADPVLNTMLRYRDSDLAALLFHELAHQVVYVKDDSSFNESFAVVVEQAGLDRWLSARGQRAQLAEYQTRWQAQKAFQQLFFDTKTELRRIYSSTLPKEAQRERKKLAFQQLARRLKALEIELQVRSPYSKWIATGFNNAHLAATATYSECLPGFERVLASVNNDLKKFYAQVRDLAKQPRAERRRTLCTG